MEELYARSGEVSAETEHFLPLAHFDLNARKPMSSNYCLCPDHKIKQHAEALIGQMTEYTENKLPALYASDLLAGIYGSYHSGSMW